MCIGTSGWLATTLDQEMLENNAYIFPRRTPIDSMRRRRGTTISKEIGGRYLLHYLTINQVGRFTGGRHGQTFVTPTPYSPEETIHYLALPNPTLPRSYVLLLDPQKISYIYGPRWTALGPGIEYILPNGFDQNAIVSPPDAATPWEIIVR